MRRGGVVLLLIVCTWMAGVGAQDALDPDASGAIEITLGGAMSVTVDVSETVPLGIQQISLSEFIEICSFTAELQAGFTEGVFDAFGVQVAGPLGELDLSSTLTLNPDTASFESWRSGIAFSILTVDVVDTLFITLPQTASYNQFLVSGNVGDCTFQLNNKMGTSPFCFQAANVCFGWPTSLCGAMANACALFTDEGFDNLTVGLSDLLWYESGTGLRALLDTTFTFTTDVKLVDVAARLDTDWGICPGVEAFVDLSQSVLPLIIDGLQLHGLIFELQIGSVLVSLAESLEESSDSTVTGKAGAAERLGVASTLDGCCGAPGSFSVDAYFTRDPGVLALLFDWFLTEISYSLPLFENLTVSGAAWYAADSPIWGGSVSVSFTW